MMPQWDQDLLLLEETVPPMPESSTEKRTGKDGLKILTTKKMPPLLKLKLDYHTHLLSLNLMLLLTRVKNSRTPHLLPQFQNTELESSQDKLPLTEETVLLIWALSTVRKTGKHGLKI
jgi:hypothetical protein